MAEDEDLIPADDAETEEVDVAEAPEEDEVEATDDAGEESGDESGEAKPAAKRGRPTKEPPPPKLWRLEGVSPEGLRVTLGRYVNKEEAEPDLERLEEDGFYEKLKITKSKDD